MCPHIKKINNESGVVLFFVLMTAIIIMIFSLGILNQSVNENNYAQQQVDQATCDQLKMKAFWQSEANKALLPIYQTAAGFTTTINGRTYTVKATTDNQPIQKWQFTCSYDTFQ